MSRPWEAVLAGAPFDSTRRCLTEDGGRMMVAILRADDAQDWETFFRASPAMAQALLAVLETTRHGVLTTEALEKVQAALQHAGVPTP